jgi:hypothetical protein
MALKMRTVLGFDSGYFKKIFFYHYHLYIFSASQIHIFSFKTIILLSQPTYICLLNYSDINYSNSGADDKILNSSTKLYLKYTQIVGQYSVVTERHNNVESTYTIFFRSLKINLTAP